MGPSNSYCMVAVQARQSNETEPVTLILTEPTRLAKSLECNGKRAKTDASQFA